MLKQHPEPKQKIPDEHMSSEVIKKGIGLSLEGVSTIWEKIKAGGKRVGDCVVGNTRKLIAIGLMAASLSGAVGCNDGQHSPSQLQSKPAASSFSGEQDSEVRKNRINPKLEQARFKLNKQRIEKGLQPNDYSPPGQKGLDAEIRQDAVDFLRLPGMHTRYVRESDWDSDMAKNQKKIEDHIQKHPHRYNRILDEVLLQMSKDQIKK